MAESRHLPLDPMPSAAELRRMAAERGVLPSTMPQDASKATKAPSVRPWHPYRSKWEADYARCLELQRSAGYILAWSYEPVRLLIGAKAYYTPDFLVFTREQSNRHDDSREFHEVKGYRREAAMVRLKAAALRYPDDTFVLVTKKDGQWHHTTIGPK
jgi:hypothetical protein